MILEFTILFNSSMADADLDDPNAAEDLAECGYHPYSTAKMRESEYRASVDVCRRLGVSWRNADRTSDGDLIVEVHNITAAQVRDVVGRFEDGRTFECGVTYYEARDPVLYIDDDSEGEMLTGEALRAWLDGEEG
jgi:hypothetical protein